MTFYDQAITFVTDLFNQLEKQSQSQTVGEGNKARETASSTLLRLIGVLSSPDIKVDGKSTTQQAPTTSEKTLLHSFLKVKTKLTEQQIQLIHQLLITYRSRLTRYSRVRSKIKLNRIKKLIDAPKNPIKTSSLIKKTPEDTRREITLQLQKLQQAGDTTGLLVQEININQALTQSVSEITNAIPQDIGVIRPQLVGLLGATGKDSSDQIEKLTALQKELTKEALRLENDENLLFKGQKTFIGDTEKLSLLQVLDLLILLTDRQKVKYQCSECKFFRTGKTPACLFASSGGSPKTAQVTIQDTNGSQVLGRLTKPTNSCFEVWSLDTNEHFTPSEAFVKALEKILKGS